MNIRMLLPFFAAWFIFAHVVFSLPVFPGAEGFGTATTAGRGGDVIEVTSLADSGPGTLRDALEKNTDGRPRTIVFAVGGTIELQGELFAPKPFTTIAGQTAPGDGITIKNAGFVILSHDILVQHIRVRPGNTGNINPETNDALQILGSFLNEGSDAYNVVLDHLSVGWSEDEALQGWFGTYNLTVSNSIISEALNHSRHPKITHSAGLILGQNSTFTSVHHNLLAHNDFRNPLIARGGLHDIRGNVIYDPGSEATSVSDYFNNTFVNMVGNTYIWGPSSDPVLKPIKFESISPDKKSTPKLYAIDNVGPNNASDQNIASFFKFDINTTMVPPGTLAEQIAWARSVYFSATPFPAPLVTLSSTPANTAKVLQSAGATKPVRDAIDSRVVNDVVAGTGRIIDSPTDVGGYVTFAVATRPTGYDTDHDGMPNAWELQNGLNPNALDGNYDNDYDGYTNLEEYLHEAAGITTTPVITNTTLQITNVSASGGLNSSVISWATNIPATYRLNYGTTTNYGSVATNFTQAMAHSARLTNLTPYTNYYYMITSYDANNNSAVRNGSFMTVIGYSGIIVRGHVFRTGTSPCGACLITMGMRGTTNSSTTLSDGAFTIVLAQAFQPGEYMIDITVVDGSSTKQFSRRVKVI